MHINTNTYMCFCCHCDIISLHFYIYKTICLWGVWGVPKARASRLGPGTVWPTAPLSVSNGCLLINRTIGNAPDALLESGALFAQELILGPCQIIGFLLLKHVIKRLFNMAPDALL